MDSTIWNDFQFREGDVVIANYGKSGCTWVQQIVGQLVFQAAEGVCIGDISPWLELPAIGRRRLLARLENQQHRRIIKTHLPVDALVYSPIARYLYIGRDGRDVAWSLFNHLRRLNDSWYRYMRTRARLHGFALEQPDDFRTFFVRWLHEDGYPFWPFWSSVRSWWDIRSLPNIMFVHFSELKDDLAGVARKIARFLEISIEDHVWSSVVEHCTFGYMKAHADRIVRHGDVFIGGARSFFDRGDNGMWRAVLGESDLQRFERAEAESLPADCVAWLRHEGSLVSH
jgi:aryl sulfotransferase